jgi:hypothetical protein
MIPTNLMRTKNLTTKRKKKNVRLEKIKKKEQTPIEYIGNQEYKPIAKKLIRRRN